MIGKQVPNPKKSSSKAERVGLLTSYIVNPELKNGQEKCVHHEAENFTTNELDLQVLEMIALSRQAVRSKDPIDHYVLSWQYGEAPTVDQAREAVRITMKHLGLTGHQLIWAMHADTDNIHIHIEVNRVHPDTYKVVEINDGFQLNAIQQAAAMVEKAQGWKLHDKARFRTDEFGHLIIDKATGRPQIFEETGKVNKPTGKVKDREIQTGEKSAQRIGIESAPAIIASATSWADLHAKMQAAGMEYVRQGSGAAIKVGDTVVKASDIVDRKSNFGSLQKRFGIYQPSNQPEIRNDPYNRTNLIDDNRFKTGFDESNFVATGFDTLHPLRDLSSRDLDVTNNPTQKKSDRKNLLQSDESPDNRRIERVRRGGDSNSPERSARERDFGKVRSKSTHLGERSISQANNDGNTSTDHAADARPGRGRTVENGRGGRRDGFTVGAQTQNWKDNQFLSRKLNDRQTGWAEYQHIKAERDAAKSVERLALQKRHDAERAALAAKQRAERGELFSGDWKGKGEAKNRAKSLVATVQAAETLELRERLRAELKALQAKYKPLPDYKQWRKQPQIVGLVILPLVDQHAERDKQVTVAKTLRSLTHTVDARGHVTYAQAGKDVFRDEGRTIAVLDLNSDAGIAAALAVAQQKFGVLTLTGSPEFQRNAVAVAVANNLTCKFADPQLEAMREQLQQQKYQAAPEAARAEHEREAAAPATVADKPKRVSWKERMLAQEAAKAAVEAPPAPAISPIQQQPGEAVSLDLEPQNLDSEEEKPAEQLPPDSPAPTAAEWIAANALRQFAAFAGGGAKTKYWVKYAAADGIVVDHGNGVAIYPKPDGDDLHAGDPVTINEGALSRAAEREKGGTEL